MSYLVESENLRRKQQEQHEDVVHKENKRVEKFIDLNQIEENIKTEKKDRTTRKLQKKQNQSSNTNLSTPSSYTISNQGIIVFKRPMKLLFMIFK